MASGSPWGRKIPSDGKSNSNNPEDSEFPALGTEIFPSLSATSSNKKSFPASQPLPKPYTPDSKTDSKAKPEPSPQTVSSPSIKFVEKTNSSTVKSLKPQVLIPAVIKTISITSPEPSCSDAKTSSYAKTFAKTISSSPSIPAEKPCRSMTVSVRPVENVYQRKPVPVAPRKPRPPTSKGLGRKDRPNPEFLENQSNRADHVKSRQSTLPSKKGTSGVEVALVANFFKLVKLTDFGLFQYHLDFKPDEERTSIKKALVKRHEKVLGAFIFDGQSLFSPCVIKLKELYSTNERTKTKFVINLKKVAEIRPTDTMFLQVYNLIIRNTMPLLGLELVGRHYFDPARKMDIPTRKLEVWPGYMTSVRNHENEILLNLEPTHKVVRTDSVLDFIKNVQETFGKNYQREITKQLLGSIVLTSYNNKTYNVDDVIWGGSPMDTFNRSGSDVNYVTYYKEQYGIIIKHPDQPLIASLPKKKDIHKGKQKAIILIPELCKMTGLSDSMRKNMDLMKEISKHLAMDPANRIKLCKELVLRWCNNPKVVEELRNWNIEIDKEPTKLTGRVVELDPITLRNGEVRHDNGDWTNELKDKPMYRTVPLNHWLMIVPKKCDEARLKVIDSLRATARSMGFQIDVPVRFDLRDERPPPGTFVHAIETLYRMYLNKGTQLQMVAVILPTSSPEVYSAIKKKCYQDLGVSSQCILLNTIMRKPIVSISSRLAIQMNAKLGGEPWCIKMPRTSSMMVCGFDVFHSANKKAKSIGALVTSMSPNLTKYFVTTRAHSSRNDLSNNLCNLMEAALRNFLLVNTELPKRIILYRDGVGDGQLAYVYNTEMQQIQDAITRVYSEYSIEPPKFSFIVVTKRIHARVMKVDRRGVVNPPPGTVVDDVITLPERYDFFLVSQNVVGSGTVSPTSYNVLKDEQGIPPDLMQKFTLRLCQLYYNYSGTIAVPAPCQYAHKLAYLSGTSLDKDVEVHGNLRNFLYFL
ncbi:Protein piwi [Orchesella cincta]|uniref:Protein piwi n=1 Tax=Orchesella cincta TaxID=48709 RepID=A0A1D2N4E6_ORCCI|nr:Protein piwi [Orchesella cincta]